MEVKTLEVIIFYYTLVFLLVGVAGSLVITILEEVYDMEYCLSNKSDFIRCVFMYQFQVKVLFDDYISTAGIVIVEILVTLSVWFLNIGIFFILLFCLLIKAICYGFWLIFRKRNEEEKYKERD